MSILAKAEAQKIIDYYGIISPENIDLNIIAAGLGVYIEEKDIEGAEGRITHNGKNGIIAVNSRIDYTPKKRFTIAHELGHFRLHKSTKLFGCTKETFFDFQNDRSQETEANVFAAELLMPETIFRKYVKGKMISQKLLSDTSTFFGTSLQSTAFRYAETGPHPIAIVFCEDGQVKWSKINRDFNYKFIPFGMRVSKNSYAFDFFEGKTIPTSPEEISLEAWFSEAYNYKANKFIFEQCFQFKEINALLVILWER